MNKYIMISGFLMISGFITCSTWAQDEMEKIDQTAFVNPGRVQAVFRHDEHNEMAEIEACGTCHHVYEGKELVEDETSEDSQCSECHTLKKSEENTVPLVLAFHKRCRNCHFEENKGPVLCGECHVKRPGRIL